MSEQTMKQTITVDRCHVTNKGIKLLGGEWINYNGLEPDTIQERMKTISSGDVIEVELLESNPKKFVNFVFVSKSKNPPSSKDSFMDDYKGIEDLLHELHRISGGQFTICTELLQLDTENKIAVAKAIIELRGESGSIRVCTGIGDASPDSIQNNLIAPHYVRMAETRAIVRALRLICNHGKVTREELHQGDKR